MDCVEIASSEHCSFSVAKLLVFEALLLFSKYTKHFSYQERKLLIAFVGVGTSGRWRLITDFWNGADLQWRRNERLCLLTSWATLSCFLFPYNNTVLNLMSSNFHHLMLDCLIWLLFIRKLWTESRWLTLFFFYLHKGSEWRTYCFLDEIIIPSDSFAAVFYCSCCCLFLVYETAPFICVIY